MLKKVSVYQKTICGQTIPVMETIHDGYCNLSICSDGLKGLAENLTFFVKAENDMDLEGVVLKIHKNASVGSPDHSMAYSLSANVMNEFLKYLPNDLKVEWLE
jgi:hypothetical protein